jgi:pimeloyl-ACP methyl ester carboxylesterase
VKENRLQFLEKVEHGSVQLTPGRESIGYSLFEVRCITEDINPRQDSITKLECDLSVFIPGHGQKAWTAKKLIYSLAMHTTSGLVWSLDIDPPSGGDPKRAEALLAILRRRTDKELGWKLGEAGQPLHKLALFGWSHGGGEALRTAALDPSLFQQVAVFCPAGLIERKPVELAWSFSLESLRIFFYTLSRSLRKLFLASMLMLDILAGMFGDLFRTRSLKRVIGDFIWVCHKVTGPDYAYTGQVALIFGQNDTVIRWRDVFPTLSTPEEVAQRGAALQRENFPLVEELAARVIPGNHASPETDPDVYMDCALQALGCRAIKAKND